MYPQITPEDLMEFIKPFYENKDIMHNMWHIELLKKQIDKILRLGGYQINYDNLMLAMCFHGFIYSDEEKIRAWLTEHGVDKENVEKIIETAWESQRSEVPGTPEGKILHDAHVLEGGRTYLVVKTLITGSVRGQTLPATLEYMKEHVLNQNRGYLKETIPLCEAMNRFTEEFYEELVRGVGMYGNSCLRP